MYFVDFSMLPKVAVYWALSDTVQVSKTTKIPHLMYQHNTVITTGISMLEYQNLFYVVLYYLF